MTSQRRSRVSNDTSNLLNGEETQVLTRLIGNRCVSLSTTVAQILVAPGPHYNHWKIECTGVLTFVKDNPKRSYYIRVYDIKTGGLIWEQEIYNQFKYKEKTRSFHTFEADSCPAGLNFANEDEAFGFAQAVQEKLRQRKQRRDERRRQAQVAGSGSQRPPKTGSPRNAANTMTRENTAPPPVPVVSPSLSETSGKDTLRKKDKKKDKGKKKLTKSDIGAPTNFKHVGHVGWDPEKGFDMDNLDPDLKTLFDQVGVSEEQLKDKATASFIYDFLEQRGGIDKVKEDIRTNRAPPPLPPSFPPSRDPHHMAPPTMMAPPPPGRGMGSAPPPPPSRSGMPPPPPPSRSPAAPPPPPPSRGRTGAPPPPPPPASRAPVPPSAAPPPPPPPAMSAPPPPPPPPPAVGGPPPPPPPPVGNAPPPPPPPSGRADLLSQIQTGAQLKHVDSSEKKAPAPDARGALLDQIRGGAKLNKVDTSQIERPKSDIPQDGIAGALARALAARAKGVQGDEASSDDDTEDDDDDEWD